MRRARVIAVLLAAAASTILGGCAVGKLVGGMAQNYEYSKLIEVHPAYNGLENKTVAIIVDVDMVTLYEHPEVALTIGSNLAIRLQRNVPGIRVLPYELVSEWQYRTPQWNALPYSEVADKLNVERIVHVDIHEFRLHPPGNQWLWDGVCAANVGIIEREGYDPDSYIEQFGVEAVFPDVQGLTRESAEAAQIQMGLLALFTRESAWLFYRHLEPKFPEHYKGPIEEDRYDGE